MLFEIIPTPGVCSRCGKFSRNYNFVDIVVADSDGKVYCHQCGKELALSSKKQIRLEGGPLQ